MLRTLYMLRQEEGSSPLLCQGIVVPGWLRAPRAGGCDGPPRHPRIRGETAPSQKPTLSLAALKDLLRWPRTQQGSVPI